MKALTEDLFLIKRGRSLPTLGAAIHKDRSPSVELRDLHDGKEVKCGKIKLQKIIGNLLDGLRNLYMNGTVI